MRFLNPPEFDLGWIDWGDAGGWAQAFGNFAVLVVAVVTIRKDSQRIAGLEERSRRDEDATARERVYGVVAWPEEWGLLGSRVLVSNGSRMPIYDVVVRALTDDMDREPALGDPGVKSVFMLNPQESLGTDLSWASEARPVVDLRFRDSVGRTWWRKGNGSLICLVDPEG